MPRDAERQRILLVEDDRERAGVVAESLTAGGHAVTVAGTTAAALGALIDGRVSLVLLDLHVPAVDGAVVMEAARRQREPADLVVMTAEPSIESARAALELDAAAYLPTPVDPAHLRALVDKLAGRRRTRRRAARQRRRLQQMRFLLQITETLATTRELTPLLAEITRKAAGALEAERCAVHLMVDDELVPAMAQFADGHVDARLWETFLGWEGTEDVPAFTLAIRSQRAVGVSDTTASRLVPPTWVTAFGTRAMLVVPLLRKREVIGTMTIEDARAPRAWRRDQIALATTLASPVALAVDNARLYDEAVQQRTRLAQILDSTSEGIVFVDAAGQIVSANRSAGALLAFDPARAIGFGLIDLLAGHYPGGRAFQESIAPFAALLADPDHEASGDLALPRLRRIMHWTARPTRDEAGAVSGLTLTWQDVTREREVSQMKSDFVSFVTHQLRTPLTGIKWMLELARREGPMSGEVAEYVDDARASAERLITLVNDLLDVSRLENGRVTVDPKPTALGSLTDGVLADLRSLVEERRHRLEVVHAAELPAVMVDPQMLRQVVLNLLSNAVKYTPPGGQIRIALGVANGTVAWSVTDSGIGIPREAVPQLFEKFFRAENALAMETEGTGLGLYLARLMVERFGGQMWCESEEGRGSTFGFVLPAHAAPAGAGGTESSGERRLSEAHSA